MNWQTERSMTPTQYKRIIKALGMTQGGAGRFLGVSVRTAHRYCSGEAEIPTSVALLLRAMVHHGEEPAVPQWKRAA